MSKEHINRNFRFSSQQPTTIYLFRDSSAGMFSLAGSRIRVPRRESPQLLTTAFLSGFVRHLSVPSCLWIDFPSHGLSYPAGSDSTAIRRTILPKSRLVRWLSASKSQ